MKHVELYGRVRHAVLVGGMSRREAARIFGINRRTVEKMLRFSIPPGYRRDKAIRRPKLDAYTGIIDEILEADKLVPKKQRHTSKLIFERLRDEHRFAGGITIVKNYVFATKQRQRTICPPTKTPGAALALRKQGCWFLFLPPYSPDPNPIEMAFSKLTADLRRIRARTFDALFLALGDICGLFDPDECWNFFKAAGYEPN